MLSYLLILLLISVTQWSVAGARCLLCDLRVLITHSSVWQLSLRDRTIRLYVGQSMWKPKHEPRPPLATVIAKFPNRKYVANLQIGRKSYDSFRLCIATSFAKSAKSCKLLLSDVISIVMVARSRNWERNNIMFCKCFFLSFVRPTFRSCSSDVLETFPHVVPTSSKDCVPVEPHLLPS